MHLIPHLTVILNFVCNTTDLHIATLLHYNNYVQHLLSYLFYDNVVVNADEAFDYPDLLMFAEKANLCHTASVTKMLLCLSDEAIAEAAERYHDQCEERRIRYGIKSPVTI